MLGALFPIHAVGWTKSRAHLIGGEFCYRRNLLCTTSESPTGTDKSPGVVIHEVAHFLQHCATPYGQLLDELNFRRVALTQEFLKLHDGEVLTPVYAWARLFLNSPGDCPGIVDRRRFNESVSRFVAPWSATIYLEQLLEAFDCTEVRVAQISDAFKALRVCERPILGVSDDPRTQVRQHVSIGQPKSDGTTVQPCPMIHFSETEESHAFPCPFGALQLCEGVAQLQEGFEAVIETPRCEDYLLAFGILLEQRNNSGLESTRGETDATRPTFLALADLALFVPIGTIYGHLRHDESRWADIHPGHRFLRSLQFVAEHDLWITCLEDSEVIANQICAHLNWPHPRQFLEVGACLGDHPALRRHRDACRIRLADYMAFYELQRLLDVESPTGEDNVPAVVESSAGGLWVL